ncbi:hypothetical protein ACNKHK_13310 [Shigella flexneri]
MTRQSKKVRDVLLRVTVDRLWSRGTTGIPEAFRDAYVDGALASVFHKQIINIGELKRTWQRQGVEISRC